MTLLAWVLYSVVVGLLVSGAAWCLERGLGRAHLAARFVWFAALALSAALPAIALLGPTRGAAPTPGVEATTTGAEATTRAAAAGTTLPGPGSLRHPRVLADALVNAPLARAAGLLPSERPAPRTALFLLWGGASVGLGLLLTLTAVRTRRRVRRWPRAELLRRRVRISPDVGPAVVGIRAPEIALPRWILELKAPDLELVLRHEEEHLRARDPLVLAAALLPVLAFPWNPALWWQFRRLSDAAEVDCDRRVLRGGACPRPYGELLVRLGAHGRADLLPAPGLAGRPSLLERRLKAMKKTSVRRALPLALLASTAAMSLLVLACEADTPTRSAEDARTDEAAAATEGAPMDAERILALPTPADGPPRPLFVIDGVVVSSTAAEGLDPERIESVEVLKGQAALERYGERAGAGVVSINTDGRPHELPASEMELPDDVDIVEQPEDVAPMEQHDDVSVRAGEGAQAARGAVAAPDVGPRERLAAPSPDAGRPLYVIDGVIIWADAVDLDALDIESMEVVKGAAAAELYGSRAANGVIMIVTR